MYILLNCNSITVPTNLLFLPECKIEFVSWNSSWGSMLNVKIYRYKSSNGVTFVVVELVWVLFWFESLSILNILRS